MTPTLSPKENIPTKWREIHGSCNWENILDPLHPWLRLEIVKYGEFVGATYDAFDFDALSEYCWSCSIWSKDSNWMGYVAVSNDEESQRIGRRDIVVAWRGTVAPTEWFTDLKTKLEQFDDDKRNITLQCGFLSICKSKDEFTRYNKLSASEQVMEEFKKHVSFYRENGERVSLTLTAHSLGGALALLNAYEVAISIPLFFISVVSFGAPRVGNMAFKEKLNELGVKTLGVVVKQI
ncbi:hypothetical protein GH714_005727 [Hevea brasiliensis]|uniref:Fungal lipase-type domain-containing protein n=1 Tax=Hevea brasiliensis TaxID=3981 RepID=A0A6A6LVK1_HEVBR|nr:hypothetical protein GH714_005727 [Hevea brasiliensis]